MREWVVRPGPWWGGVWGPGFRVGWVLGVRCLEVLNRWSLEVPRGRVHEPASKGWERRGLEQASPQESGLAGRFGHEPRLGSWTTSHG